MGVLIGGGAMGITITIDTIFEADRQYALYKKGQRDLPQRTTFFGNPFPTDQQIMNAVLAKADYSGMEAKHAD
ncbi:MAG: hypothetical protein EOM37_13385 [Proteobacteria bacterium]|nr:hypothetical protein [Pseudomonadota bacterium]